MKKELPPLLVKYRLLLCELIGPRRQLRTPNILYLGGDEILASLDLGYQLALAASCSKALTRALLPSPIDLAITAIYSLVLRDHLSPTSLLIGADDVVHAMNLLFINKGGCVHIIDARSDALTMIKTALGRNEGPFAKPVFRKSAVGKGAEKVKLHYCPAQSDCMVCLDEAGGLFSAAKRPKPQITRAVSLTLEDLISWEGVMGLQLVFVDAPRHLGQIFPGLCEIWSLNPFAHLILKFPQSPNPALWEELSAKLVFTGRRAWSLPNPRLIEKIPPRSGAIWITPSGV